MLLNIKLLKCFLGENYDYPPPFTYLQHHIHNFVSSFPCTNLTLCTGNNKINLQCVNKIPLSNNEFIFKRSDQECKNFKVKASDLEVIILTYNRAEFLKDQLSAVCSSTLKGFYITILDNHSDDNTMSIIENYRRKYEKEFKFKIIYNEKNIGNFGNFLKAQKIACQKYVCILHDDDIIHPYYFEYVLKALNKFDNLVVVSGVNNYYINPSKYDFKLPNNSYFFYNKKTGPVLSLFKQRFTFQCSVYNTNVFKQIRMSMNSIGKLWDICFLIDALGYGNSLMFQWEVIKIRFHPGQDSETNINGPFVYELVNLIFSLKKSINTNKNFLKGLALYNFAYEIFVWSKIRNFSFFSVSRFFRAERCFWKLSDDFAKEKKS